MKNYIYIIIFLTFLLFGFFVIYRIEKIADFKEFQRSLVATNLNKNESVVIPEIKFTNPDRIVYLDVNDSKIIPNEVVVKKDEDVSIRFRVAEGYHNLNISKYNIKTIPISTSQTSSLDFTATMSGKFIIFSKTYMYKKEPAGLLIVQ